MDTYIDGKKYQLTSIIYAPQDAVQCKAFYTAQLTSKFITKTTILGMDANCVPDPRLDVRSPSNHPNYRYANEGASELDALITSAELTDVAGENGHIRLGPLEVVGK